MGDTLTIEGPTVADRARPTRRHRRLGWSIRRCVAGVASVLEWLFGAASLVLGLSIVASLPLAQLATLGYLMEASGRVARSGRLRDGWIGVRRAGRVGGLVAGCFLSTMPLRLVASLATSAALIDPGGPVARRWRVGLIVFASLTAVQIASACARGGKLRHFAWPPGTLLWAARRLRRGGLYSEARDATLAFVAGLRLPHYFRVGLMGYVGTMAWLAVPVGLMAVGKRHPALGFVGAFGLILVAQKLPFLQVRFASEGRWATFFEPGAVRDRARRAPWAFALATIATMASAVPLYLLKIEMVPAEAAWLPGLAFVLFLFPARLACGWAHARSNRREKPRHWASRALSRLAVVPFAAAYVLIVYLAQYTSWGGAWSLGEQHAFLLPAPFVGY